MTTTDDAALDDGALFPDPTTDDGGDEQPPVPDRIDVAHAAHGVVYTARSLTVGDLMDCGPGLLAAVDQLAAALTHGKPIGLLAAAMVLVDVKAETEPCRAALDARPARSLADGRGEMYPRDITVVPPRYGHADRRAPLMASIDLLGWHVQQTEGGAAEPEQVPVPEPVPDGPVTLIARKRGRSASRRQREYGSAAAADANAVAWWHEGFTVFWTAAGDGPVGEAFHFTEDGNRTTDGAQAAARE